MESHFQKQDPRLPINNIISANTRGPCCVIFTFLGRLCRMFPLMCSESPVRKNESVSQKPHLKLGRASWGQGVALCVLLLMVSTPNKKGEWDEAWLQSMTP